MLIVGKMFGELYRAKLIVVGDATVGKTAITQMFLKDGSEFPKTYNMTFIPDVNAKVVQIHGTDDRVELLVYDTPGLDLYADSLNKHWTRPDLLMVVFDVGNRKSLDFVGNWHRIAMGADWSSEDGTPIATVLFGNKTDLARICTDEDAEEAAQGLSAKYFSGSAKDNLGLDEAFYYLAETFHKFSIRK